MGENHQHEVIIMFSDDYLTLRLTKLINGEKWEPPGAGVCFLFARSGVGNYINGLARHVFSQGDVLIVSRKSGDQIVATDEGELVFFGVSMLVEHMFPLFSAKEISLLQNLMDNFSTAKIHSAESPLAVECHRLISIAPPPFNLDHRAHLLRLVATILDEEFKLLQQGRPRYISVDDHLIQVFETLSANDLLTLPTEELSAKFGCGRRHLSRLFRQHFGFSVSALRMELRMLRAISLLRDANSKVHHVAEQCGFNHHGLFNTCFKRRFGTTPGRWRALGLNPSTAADSGEHFESLFRFNNNTESGVAQLGKTSKTSAAELKNDPLVKNSKVSSGLERILATALPSRPAPSLIRSEVQS
jgi:AraC-like DNA-binding protein